MSLLSAHPAARGASRHLRTKVAALSVVAAVIGLSFASPAASVSYAQIEGSGSTWSQVIFDQWIADVNPLGIRVSYNGAGSSQGRKDFTNYTNDFAISEIPYQGVDELGQADSPGDRAYAYMPIVAGGTAFTYHLEAAGQLMRGIRLSGETLAKIFTGVITSWDDPQIAAENNGRSFPATRIIPVVRSDGSGTTAQFTTFLSKQYPDLWKACFAPGGLTSYYPRNCSDRTVAQAGSDQVMNFIASKAGNGTIGYVEYSYPTNKNFPVVKVLNKAGYYVEPTQYNVAVALTRARIETQNTDPKVYLTQILDDVYTSTDPQAYPLSSYSYMVLPTGASDRRLTTNKRQSLVDLMFYALCEGQSKAGPYGYSPMPLNLVQAGFEQLAKLKTADPAVEVDNRDATKCNNPTFVPGDLTRNHLAEIAPLPADCDKQGQGPCDGEGGSTGGNDGGATGGHDSGGGGAGDGSGGSGAVTGDGGTGGSGGSGGAGGTGGDSSIIDTTPVFDPVTGEVVSGEGGTDGSATDATGKGGASNQAVSGPVASNLAARSAGSPWLFGGLASALLLGVILAPGLLALPSKRKAAVR